MFKIGDFSKLTMITIRMLRHYDEIGLLTPAHIDRFTGYRYYTADQLFTANRIQALKNMGFGLSAIKLMLDNISDSESLLPYLRVQEQQLAESAQKLQTQMHLIQTAIERLGKENSAMTYQATTKTFPTMNMMTLRRIIPSYNREDLLWEQLCSEAAKHGMNIQCSSPRFSCAVFYDEGFKEHDVDVEIRIAVNGTYPDTEFLRFKTIPPVTAATVIVNGSYEQLPEACAAVGKWMDDNGYELDGPMFTVYHVNPSDDPNPDNWVTEVCYPIKK